MTTERDKLIVEALGYEYLGSGINEVSYREPVTAARCIMDLANFFFFVWERAQKMEWWPEFKAWFWGHDGVRHLPMMIPEELIHLTRFPDALADWLEANPEKWRK